LSNLKTAVMAVSVVGVAFACPFLGEKVLSVGAVIILIKVLSSKIVLIHL
jgi:hypothetical protein